MTLELQTLTCSAPGAIAFDERASPWRDLEELQPLVKSFLRQKLRDENDVEDIVQECLLRAARHRAHEGEPDKLSAWMLRIAENALTDHRRRTRRSPALESETETLDRFEGRELTPGEEQEGERVLLGDLVLERDDVFACMAHSLRSMARVDQVVLESYYAGSGRCAEIARVTAVEPTRIKSRLFRARRRLSRLVLRQLPELEAPLVPEMRPPAPAKVEVAAQKGRTRRAHEPRAHEKGGRGARCAATDRGRRRGAAGARTGEG